MQFAFAGIMKPCLILFYAVILEFIYLTFNLKALREVSKNFKYLAQIQWIIIFFVFIFLSQQIFGLSETQFDRLYNQNYHSKSRNVSARL